jgi:hypothetical protein
MRRSAVTQFFLILLAAASAMPAQDTKQIRWMGSLDEALAEAKRRKAPVLLAINHEYDRTKERERHEANLQMADTVYRDPEVVKISRRFVCLVAGPHTRPLDVANDSETCRRFGVITYAQLQSITAAVRTRYFPGEAEIVAPQHLILDADGRLIDRYLLGRTAPEFAKLLQDALARARGASPTHVVPGDVKSVLSAFKSRDTAERSAAFKKALEILTADKDQKAVREAAKRYLQTLRGFMEVREALEAVTAAGTEGPLSLLLPYLEHSRARMRRAVLDIYARATAVEAFLKPLGKRVKRENVEGPLEALVKVFDHYADTFKDAIEHLNKLVSHKQPSVKVLASFAAARPGNKPVYKKFLSRTRREANLLVRTAAILSLAKMQAREALPVLEAVRKKETRNPSITRAVDVAIAALGGTAGDPKTAGNLQQEIDRVKREAATERGDRGGWPGGGWPGGGRGGGGGGR